MHSISAACVAISVESIVESVVSIYETRQTKSRTLSDDRANYEMQIGYNGPDLAKADTMLKKAMDSYFKAHKQGKWHFTIDPNRLKYTVSKVVDKKWLNQARCFLWIPSKYIHIAVICFFTYICVCVSVCVFVRSFVLAEKLGFTDAYTFSRTPGSRSVLHP